MQFVEFGFYIKNEQSLEEDIAKWCELKKFIKKPVQEFKEMPS